MLCCCYLGSLISLLFLHLSLSFPIPDSNPLLSMSGQVRNRHLYAESPNKGVFLEINPSGIVRGSPIQTDDSELELKSVSPGLTVIRGVTSLLYLCVDSAGQLKGQKQYAEADCAFTELIENGYTRFLSPHHGHHVSLDRKGPVERPNSVFSRFIPQANSRVHDDNPNVPQTREVINTDSDDPFGMVMSSEIDPMFY
ncbi:fibroblast growth factor 21 [Denticeps clupeoides]|uniref:FGF n=1 Tax=Denticeps clupeoides TaxID=299321 RepID=A0AAY4AJY2_9TELE|nr:fibroblast growth factor 21-like [Denticeps clupeoides]